MANLINPFWAPPPSPPLPAAPYWRMLCHGSDPGASNPTYMYAAEMEMASSPGGANLCTGGTAIGQSGVGGGIAVANLFDGDPATFLEWATGLGQAAGYHFAAGVSIAEVRLQATVANSAYMWRGFTPQYSFDGVAWVSCAPVGPTAAFAASEWRSFPVAALVPADRTTALFWRLSSVTGGVQVGDTGFLAVSGGPSLCVGGLALAAGEINGTVAARFAFDGVAATRWLATTPNTIQYFFLAPPNPSHMTMQAFTSSPANTPSSWDVDWSGDGVAWTNVASIAGQTGWTASELREYPL